MATEVSATFDELHRQTVSIVEKAISGHMYYCNDGLHASNNPSVDLLNQFNEQLQLGADDSSFDHDNLRDVRKCRDECEQIMGQLDNAKSSLAQLNHKYESVADKTSSLHDACDQLMADQTKLSTAAEDIRSKLAYFDRVDQICQKLSSPMLSVTGESFAHMLTTIDECMLFLSQQKEYSEAAAYYTKYEQCLSRALSLVKGHITRALHQATGNIMNKLSGGDANEDTFTLYYGMFASHAPSVHQLMENLEAKWDTNTEYESMLNDCYQVYFSQRETLLRPSVTATIDQLKAKHTSSICSLTRSGCGFLLRLCEDEYRLYFQFFTRPSPLLHDFTESMCRLLYDAVRPVVVHMPHLETLSQLSTIINQDMIQERCALDDDVFSGFVRVMSELVGDVHERLVYRANVYGQSDILNYNPAPGDLAYPEKLHMMMDIANQSTKTHTREASVASLASVESATSAEVAQISAESEEKEQVRQVSAADLHGLWYPTVRRTVQCLSKLYKCLDTAVFQGISQDILNMCVQSLVSASDKIAKNKRPLDAQLFLVKHLLIVREQTSPFRVNMTVKETWVDFSKIKTSAYNLLNHKDRWFSLNNNNALLEFLFQVPAHVVEHVIDTRRIVDLRLRDACQKFIGDCSNKILFELNDWMIKADVVLNMNTDDNAQNPVPLNKQPFATTQHLNGLTSQAFRKMKENIPIIKSALNLYVGNKDTENILFAPIKKNVHTAFTRLIEICEKNYDEEQLQVIALPSLSQVNLLLSA